MQTETHSAIPARTEEMAVIHRIFRRGFPMVADLVRHTPAGATTRSEPIAAHLDFLLNGLHGHHSAEDENIWPRLLERAAPHAELIVRMEKQHEVVAGCSERVRTLLEVWRRSAAGGDSLATALDAFTAALVEHLDDEEAHVVPLIRANISAEEWTRFGQEAFEKFTNAEKLIATGTLEEVATPEEARWFTGDLPLPIKLMWRLVGRRKYARYMQRVLGRGALARTVRTPADTGGMGRATAAPEQPHQLIQGSRGGASMNRSRTAALVTWTYAAMFGLPAVPVAIFLAENGRLPSLWGLFDMYAGPWSSRFASDRVIALLLVYAGLVLAAVLSGWLLWKMRKSGAVLNLGLLPVEAFFWVGFALPIPWAFGIARVALVFLAWPELAGSPRHATAAAPARNRLSS